MRAFLIASALALGACASSGRALPAGPDTYTLTERFVPIRGGGDEAQRQALTKANDFCTTMGKKFVPNNMGRADGPVNQTYGPTSYTVTFKCLLPNDPAVAAYQLQQAPNVIVEQRNR